MSNRGRPKTPGILTPREQEVLSLIRQGLSNREIAERLDISLAGAKFHVSEIISKLGVSGRDEAAAWREEGSSVFGTLLALPTVLAYRVRLLLPTSKLAAIAVALPAVATLVVGTTLGVDGHILQPRGDRGVTLHLVTASPTPPSSPVAYGIVNCLGANCPLHLPERYASTAEAAAQASFPLKEPTYIPVGLQFKGALYNRPDPQVGGENVVLFYESDDGRSLTLSEGSPAFAFPYGSTSAPAGFSGYRNVGLSQGLWIQGFNQTAPIDVVDGKPVFPTQEWVDNDFFRFGWYVDGTAGPFEANPGHLAYSIAASGLPPNEVMRIADSVP